MEDKLLNVEEVAGYLGVRPTTVYRWCREGRLPCLKVGRYWRIRRRALEGFLEKSERPGTLVGRLRAFLEVPDNVLTIAQDHELLHRLDAAFLMVGEARGGALLKYYREDQPDLDGLREGLEAAGLEVARLEGEGRLRFVAEGDPPSGRLEALRRAAEEAAGEDRTLWASFDWEEKLDLEAALRQQEEVAGVIEEGKLVVQTGVLDSVLDGWPGEMRRRVRLLHSGTIWLSRSGLLLARVTPPLPTDDPG